MRLLLVIGFLGCCGLLVRGADAGVSFRNDIMPVLTKAGCNLGCVRKGVNEGRTGLYQFRHLIGLGR